MEYKKGSFIQNEDGTFTGRFQAFRVLEETTVTDIQDSRLRDALSYYMSNTRSTIKADAVIAARDGAFFRSVTISGGSIEIIF